MQRGKTRRKQRTEQKTKREGKKREANEYDLICWIYALYSIQLSETN